MGKKKSKLRFIMMSCGYVESNMTSWLIYQCQFFGHPGYDTAKEAVTELALDMYAKYQDEVLAYRKPKKECCKTASLLGASSNPETRLKYRFCSQCGQELDENTFDPEGFKEHIVSLHNTSCDSYGDAEYAAGRDMRWWPFWGRDFLNAKKEEIIYIPECAESVILAALIEAKPELVSEDEREEHGCSSWDEIKEGKYNPEP